MFRVFLNMNSQRLKLDKISKTSEQYPNTQWTRFCTKISKTNSNQRIVRKNLLYGSYCCCWYIWFCGGALGTTGCCLKLFCGIWSLSVFMAQKFIGHLDLCLEIILWNNFLAVKTLVNRSWIETESNQVSIHVSIQFRFVFRFSFDSLVFSLLLGKGWSTWKENVA